ncbi:hypothetical protein Tco_1161701 [Tanacetum coccineum]
MSSITTQKTKLDLEIVQKEKRLDIGKCKGRLNLGKIQREPTFQVVLDALALTPCYFAFLITADVPEVYMHQFWDSVYKHDTFYRFKTDKRRVQGQDFDVLPTDEEIVSFLRDLGHTGEIHSLNDVVVDQMHQPWRMFATLINKSLSRKTTGLDKLRLSRARILWGMYHQKNVDYVELLWEDFIYQIDNKAYKKQEKMYYPRFTKVIIHHFLTQDKTLSWRNKIGLHTSKDDYLINTLRFVFAKEETQIYGAIVPDSLTSPEIKETRAYKTYIGFASGKSKRVKRPAKKSTQAPAKARGKGIELLSYVALTEEAQYEEVRKKSLGDFHKTHPSGSDTATKPTPSVVIIKPFITNEVTGVKPRVPDVTEAESSKRSDQEKDNDDDKTQSDNENESDSKHETNESGFESDQEEDEEKIKDDEEEEEEEIVKTLSNDSNDEDEIKLADKAEGDEDKEMDYTTSQLYGDVDIRLNEPVDSDKGFVQEEGTDAAMTNVQ